MNIDEEITKRLQQYRRLKNSITHPERADPDGALIEELVYENQRLKARQEEREKHE